MRNIAYGKMNKDAKPNLYIIAGPNGSGRVETKLLSLGMAG
jgi:hypothetical protein